jgi:hypothetical protein
VAGAGVMVALCLVYFYLTEFMFMAASYPYFLSLFMKKVLHISFIFFHDHSLVPVPVLSKVVQL